MPFIFVDANTSTQHVLASNNDTYVLFSGITHYGTLSTPVIAGGGASNLDFTILGTIVSVGTRTLDLGSGGTNQEIMIGPDGGLYAETDAIYLGSGTINSRLVNNGVISGNNGVQTLGSDGHILNAGNIFGLNGDGIIIGEDTDIQNSGTIQASEWALRSTGDFFLHIDNTGSISGQFGAMQFNDGFATVSNTGDIVGDIEAGEANLTVNNTGRITGTLTGADSFGNLNYYGTEGTIEGRITGAAGIDRIEAGAENNIIYGRGGDDEIFGNGGNDFLVGEDGRDTLEGGDGDDTLFFDSEDRLISGGAGRDRAVSNDNLVDRTMIIDLDGLVFSGIEDFDATWNIRTLLGTIDDFFFFVSESK